MGIYDYTVYSVIKRNAKVHGDRIAWISGEEKITHGQFLHTVNRLAGGLLNAGIEKGDRVGVLAQNSMAYIYLYGAAAKIGAIMLPVNFRLSLEEIEFVITDGSPKLFFAGYNYKDIVNSLRSKLGFVESFYTLDKGDGNFNSFQSLLENDVVEPTWEVHSDDAFVIIHTAAVAGKPRGATLTHKGLIAANLQGMYVWQLTDKDCHLCMLPLFHLAALGTSLNVMHAGGSNVILPRFDPDLALKYIQKDKVTIFIEFPPMLQTLFDRNQELKCDLSSLRIVGGLDQPDTVKRFEQLTKATFWASYGQTETSGLVSLAPYFERPGSAGISGFMAEVEIVDDYGNILETGKTGEIVVRGPTVFKGYWNLEKDNEYTFRGGWHHTGDMGRFDEDRYLWYMGRMPEKELIKPGGENVYPAEVERAVLEHPQVEEVSVIGVPDQQWGEAIKAVCVLKKGGPLAESELVEFVASKIARFKKPKHVVYVSELPKTEDGAIDREKVKAEHGHV